MEVLPEERDRKYYADNYSCCPPPIFVIFVTLVEVSDPIFLIKKVKKLLSRKKLMKYTNGSYHKSFKIKNVFSWEKNPLNFHTKTPLYPRKKTH